MENASKALIFGGAVVISIVIISLLMLMGNSLTSYQQTSIQTEREAQIAEFNQQYVGYNRKDVRGNELVSLINKVIDYNYRKSDIGKNDEMYQPIEVTINFKGQNKKLTLANSNSIFKEDKYTFNGNSSEESLRTKVINEIKEIEKPLPCGSIGTMTFNESNLNDLVSAYDEIFLLNKDFQQASYEKKIQIFQKFNSAYGAYFFDINKSVSSFDVLNWWWILNYNVRIKVQNYYEYVQFKRAHFECVKTQYNQGTGRIVKMDFEFTGKFN